MNPNSTEVESVLRGIVGSSNCISSAEALDAASAATFATNSRPRLIVSPANEEELAKVITSSAMLEVPVYPTSRGRNWGLGSKVAPRDGSVLIDLSRFDSILEFNEELGYLRLQTGVTFEQASRFLHDQNSSWFLSVIGGPPDASVIANCLERGEGLGPKGLRPTSVCALDVTLPTGERMQTGFPQSTSRVSSLSPWNVGPNIDGLFFQSNLGIVTAATIWLQRRPAEFQSFTLACQSQENLAAVVPKLRNFLAQGTIAPCSLTFWNSYKFLASQRQYPRMDQGVPLRAGELLSLLPKQWKGLQWFAFGALYAASSEHARANKRLLRRQLRRHTARFVILDRKKAWFAERFAAPLSKLLGVDVKNTVQSLYSRSIYLGNPMLTSLKSIYWRKRMSIPAEMHADRDRCGIIWLCHIVPFRAEDISETATQIEAEVSAAGFEPNIAYLAVSERALHLFVALMYDRDVQGEDERAMRCHDSLFGRLTKLGYSPYRLGIHSLAEYQTLAGEELSLLRRIKDLLDPRGFFAPGRYDSQTSGDSK